MISILGGDATTASLALTQTEESKGAFFNGRQTRLDTGSNANTEGNPSPLTTGKDAANTQDEGLAGSKRRREDADHGDSSKQPRLENNVDIPSPPQLDNVTDEHGCYRILGFRRGRIDYDSVAVLRTKPGRVDSEPTMSMSCSDKIARWSILGLTSALVAPFIAEPIYLTSVIAGDLFDETALERALFKRISGCPITDQGNAADEGASGAQHQVDLPHPVSVYKSTEAFDYSKDVVAARSEQEGIIIPPVASPCSKYLVSFTVGSPLCAGTNSKYDIPRSRTPLARHLLDRFRAIRHRGTCQRMQSRSFDQEADLSQS